MADGEPKHGPAPSGTGPSSLDGRVRSRLQETIRRESVDGAVLGLRVRRFALLAVAVLVLVQTRLPHALFYLGIVAAFLVAGEWALRRVRRNVARSRDAYLLVGFDMALLTFALLFPNPLVDPPYPTALALKFDNFLFYFVILAPLAFAVRPSLVLWAGAAAAAAWTAGTLWIVALPGNRWRSVDADQGVAGLLRDLADPTVVDPVARIQEVAILVIVAAVLAAAVARGRKLMLRQAMAERERGNLARYFAPTIVDRLATRDTPLTAPRETQVAVLFADLEGFTGWAETRPAVEVIQAIRDVHGRLEALVFEHGGTLDKFMGDGVMATFGTPEPAADDAARAVACARAMVDAFPPSGSLALGVGVHWGPVIQGDIGTERRMEFAVLGDTVNVASRLERLTRRLQVRVVFSDAVIQAAGGPAPDLQRHAPTALRGRDRRLVVWTL